MSLTSVVHLKNCDYVCDFLKKKQNVASRKVRGLGVDDFCKLTSAKNLVPLFLACVQCVQAEIIITFS